MLLPLLRSTVVIIVLRWHTFRRIRWSKLSACSEGGHPGVREWSFGRLGGAGGGTGGFGRR